MTHGINLHEEAVRVPLIASWKGHLREGSVVEEPVALVDVAPGILGALGVEATTFSHGRKLFDAPDASRSIFLQRRDYGSHEERGQAIAGEMTAIVSGGDKLILAPGEQRRELYDLGADPHELTDLLKPVPAAAAAAASPAPAAVNPDEAARKLEDKLGGWQHEFPSASKAEPKMDEKTRKALRSLGYVD